MTNGNSLWDSERKRNTGHNPNPKGRISFGRLFEPPSRETPPLTRGRIATYFVDVIL